MDVVSRASASESHGARGLPAFPAIEFIPIRWRGNSRPPLRLLAALPALDVASGEDDPHSLRHFAHLLLKSSQEGCLLLQPHRRFSMADGFRFQWRAWLCPMNSRTPGVADRLPLGGDAPLRDAILPGNRIRVLAAAELPHRSSPPRSLRAQPSGAVILIAGLPSAVELASTRGRKVIPERREVLRTTARANRFSHFGVGILATRLLRPRSPQETVKLPGVCHGYSPWLKLPFAALDCVAVKNLD